MSAPVQRDESMSDARLYAPPWARERPLPAAGQPQFTSSPPVASASKGRAASAAARDPLRMPKGVGGPNILTTTPPASDAPDVAWTPKNASQPEAFTGDVAIQALRRRLAMEPDVVPHPPIVMRPERPFPWIARLGFVCLAAGIAAFGITALTVTDLYQPNAGKNTNAGFTQVPASDTADVTPARLVVQGGRATANEPVPLGISLKDSSGGESVFLSGLENGTRLSAGTPFGSKGWRISARELGSVMAYAPIDYIGAMHAAINLHAANNAVVDTRVVRLEWLPKNAPPRAEAPRIEAPRPEVARTEPTRTEPTRTEPPRIDPARVEPAPSAQRPAVAAAPRQPVLQLDPEEVSKLIRRGQQLLQAGDIAPARLMLQRAANAGSGQAALLLGGTYDPEVLRELGVLGFAANPSVAAEWYQKALALGVNEAGRRMERLAQSRR
jgi:hypothetical protein